MKLETLKILACPNCFNFPLEIKISKQSKKDEIIEGSLKCSSCGKMCSINDGIAKMMPDVAKLDKKHQKVMEANLIYHDLAADTYEEDVEESVHQNEFNQKRIEKIIRDLSQKIENNCFLDVGCGTGNLLKFGQKYFKNAIGIDVSIDMLKIAQERGYEVIQADAISLPFKPSAFNAISIFSVLHHLYNYSLFLKEASGALKSGGFLYTDWDPQRQPKIDERKISWQIFKLIKFLGKPLKNLLLQPEKPQGINLREIRPELKKMYEIAEYRNLALKEEKRGIDFNELKEILIENGFINIQPIFHRAGKSINQLPLPLKIRFFFFKFQSQSLERFMENIMIIAQKK